MSSVDVIVPCYRYGHFLRECVESVLTQPVNVRVLIIDDASPDNTTEVAARLAREDCRVTFLQHTANQGHIATYNEGIEWASADYMLILSADDYLLPGALKRAMDVMDRYPQVGFIFGDAIVLKEDGTSTRMRVKRLCHSARTPSIILTGVEFIRVCIQHGATNFFVVPTPTALVRTDLQKKLGGYSLNLPHSGDLEMWLRFAAHSSVAYLRSDQAVYRRHMANMSSDYSKNILQDLRQRQAAFDTFLYTCQSHDSNMFPQLHTQLIKSLALEAIHFSSSAFNEGKIDDSEEISKYALNIYPQIKKSLAWFKVVLKRRMGYKTWCALQSTVARIH